MTRVKAQDPAEGSREIIDRELARAEKKSSRIRAERVAGVQDVRRTLGDLEEAQIAHILAWRPTIADLETAQSALDGDADRITREKGSLPAKILAILEIVAWTEQEEAP
jgi:hypothetical protein